MVQKPPLSLLSTVFLLHFLVSIWYSVEEMNKAADSTTKTSQNSPFVVGTLASDILSTAWRMTVPVVVLAICGLLLDKQLDTAPWFTLLGTIVGFGFSALLVKKQIDAINRAEHHEENK